MWMCSPSILCRQHLLGCHNEIHKLVGHLRKKKSITGWIQNNCLELRSIDSYHNALVKEMRVRGYHHKSPLPSYSLDYLPENEREYQIKRNEAFRDLLNRCEKCLKRYNEINKNKEALLLNREAIFREERWQRKRLRILLSLDWNVVRKKLKKLTPRLRAEEGKIKDKKHKPENY